QVLAQVEANSERVRRLDGSVLHKQRCVTMRVRDVNGFDALLQIDPWHGGLLLRHAATASRPVRLHPPRHLRSCRRTHSLAARPANRSLVPNQPSTTSGNAVWLLSLLL